MDSGTIVEYIDRKQIVCAVVLGRKNQKLRMSRNKKAAAEANRH
jgi:hypothetical protein